MSNVTCLIDGKPHYSMTLPKGVEFVGMEATPNNKPRYGKLYHPWFNKPCYETKIGGGK
jgi:hypothetical protein